MDLHAKLLSLGAERRGRHLRIRCPAPGHTDARPSCDVDLARGFYCRSCHAKGGLRQLARLLGLEPAHPGTPQPVQDVDPWTAIVREARRQDANLAPHRDVNAIADWLRPRHQIVVDARIVASAIGDKRRAWKLLRLAARIETQAREVEALLDRAGHVA